MRRGPRSTAPRRGRRSPTRSRRTGHHEPELRGLVHDLVEGDACEVGELELDDRPQAGERGADAAADEPALGERRVADPLCAEALVQPLGRAEEPPDPADVLAHHEHVGVGLELERETLADGCDEAEHPLGLDGRGWVAALRREDGRHQVGRVGVGVRERRRDRMLHVALDLPRECVERLVVELAAVAQQTLEAGQWVAPLPLGDERRVADVRQVRAHRVLHAAEGLHLEKGRALAVACPGERPLDCVLDRDHVVPVDDLAGHPVRRLTEQYFADDAFEEGLRTVVPQGRVGVADDVADAALYLASDQSAYVNGIALTVDGGWLAEKSFAAGEAAGRTFLAANETRDDV